MTDHTTKFYDNKIFLSVAFLILSTILPFLNKYTINFSPYPMITLSYILQVILISSIHLFLYLVAGRPDQIVQQKECKRSDKPSVATATTELQLQEHTLRSVPSINQDQITRIEEEPISISKKPRQTSNCEPRLIRTRSSIGSYKSLRRTLLSFSGEIQDNDEHVFHSKSDRIALNFSHKEDDNLKFSKRFSKKVSRVTYAPLSEFTLDYNFDQVESVDDIFSMAKEADYKKLKKSKNADYTTLKPRSSMMDQRHSQISRTKSVVIEEIEVNSGYKPILTDFTLLMPVAFIYLFSFSFSQFGIGELKVAVNEQIKRFNPLFSLILLLIIDKIVAYFSQQANLKTKEYTATQVASILLIAFGGLVAIVGYFFEAEDILRPDLKADRTEQETTEVIIQTFTIAIIGVFLKALFTNLTEKLRPYYTIAMITFKSYILSLLILPVSTYILEKQKVAIFWQDITNFQLNFSFVPILLFQAFMGILMKEVQTRTIVFVGAVETSILTCFKSLIVVTIDVVKNELYYLVFLTGIVISIGGMGIMVWTKARDKFKKRETSEHETS